jgi:hypothetical protein
MTSTSTAAPGSPSANSETKRNGLAGAIAFVLVGVVVVAAVGFGLHQLSADPQKPLYATMASDTVTVNGQNLHKASVTLGVYPDKATAEEHGSKVNAKDWVQYGPSSHLVLPQHTLVTMTLHVYDSGEELNNAFFGKVIGTVGGTINVDGKDVSSVPANEVQHTFTLHGLPTSSQDPLFVNVPLLRVTTDDKDNFIPTKDAGTDFKGHTVIFSFITGGKGEYVWNCEYPCGDGTYRKFGAVMGAVGYMTGKVTVA